MRSRGLVVAIAVVLAVLAAVGVIVYTNSVRDSVISEETVVVIVSTQDIPANTVLDGLVDAAVFTQLNVPNDAVVAGAVTSTDELRGKVTSSPILANEQIPLSRLGEGALDNVGISEGHVGLGLEVNGPQAVNGLIQRGNSVVLYATFNRGTVVTDLEMKALLQPAQIKQLIAAVGAPTNAKVVVMPVDFTTTLIPTAKVLFVQNPTVDETTGRQTQGGSVLVLDLLPTDAQDVVFATSAATLYLGLLPKQNAETGYPESGTIGPNLSRVIGVAKS